GGKGWGQGTGGGGWGREMVAGRDPGAEEMDAYERVLGDAIAGDTTLFAREDSVEEAWRIVDPILKDPPRLIEYEPGSWGPSEVDRTASPVGGWGDPAIQWENTLARRCR